MNSATKAQKEEAAQLIAEGRYEFKEIAQKIGINRETLSRWRREKKFAARVDEISADFARSSKRLAIARKDYRVGVLNKLQTKLETLIEQRAVEMVDTGAGGDTGLLVKQFKVSGETVVTEYAFDAAVVRELRAVQEQAAKELGQFVEKHEHKIGGLKDLSDDELISILADTGDEAETQGEDPAGAGEAEAA